MLRRHAVSLLFGTAAARGAESLARFVDTEGGAAILVDVATRRVIAAHDPTIAAHMLAPPGSTLKPFVLAALLRSGKLAASEAVVCTGRLSIGNRQFNCSHPVVDAPMHVDTAIAYSCNFFVARMADRFSSGELARVLEAAGLAGRIVPARAGDPTRLQALGEGGVLVTPAGLAGAYRHLARDVQSPEMQPIRDGLEGAVEFGTAQRAQVAGVKVAGKTGSIRTSAGARIAWFAGFLPSRAPEVVVAVMLPGYSGGSDAAPVGGRILDAYRTGRL